MIYLSIQEIVPGATYTAAQYGTRYTQSGATWGIIGKISGLTCDEAQSQIRNAANRGEYVAITRD